MKYVECNRRISLIPRREARCASGTVISCSWHKQPIPTAPWLVRLTHAAGIPLKSVGGRSRRFGFRMSCSNAATRRAGLHGSLEWDARKLRTSHRHGGTDRKGQSETSLITMSMRFSRYMDAAQTASHIPVQKSGNFEGVLRNFSKIFSSASNRLEYCHGRYSR